MRRSRCRCDYRSVCLLGPLSGHTSRRLGSTPDGIARHLGRGGSERTFHNGDHVFRMRK